MPGRGRHWWVDVMDCEGELLSVIMFCCVVVVLCRCRCHVLVYQVRKVRAWGAHHWRRTNDKSVVI